MDDECAASGGVRIGVSGALGRMGRALAGAIVESEAVLGPLADRPDLAGQTLEGVALTDLSDLVAGSDAILDFSTPEATVKLVRACAARPGPALIIGTTGFSAEAIAEINAASSHTAILRSGNFSLGVNLLMGLVEQAARALPAHAFDVEIFEAHHRRKVDAPSGTALMLGQAAAQGRGQVFDRVSERGRDGVTGPRAEGAIGFSVFRGGGVIGEHSVSFAGEDEIITLTHSARDRGLFARGAVVAALWAASRPPGLYDMMDVLGLKPAS